ncbi:MAG: UvrB/UvrC motif-containing protein, partial [Proteobacteria bacterium]|nr:UvrB/UvrC motif-containing protein [Pseudomonadota bacterium]
TKPQFKVAEEHPGYNLDNPKQLGKLIAKLEKQMFAHAHDMEFEEAAKLRDEIERIKNSQFIGG